MNLDELRSVQAKERRKDSLQHLRDAFYDDVAAYVSDLRAARDRRAEQVDNPFSDDDVRRMSDELETAEEVAEALYERRVGKVVKLASFAAADMSVETEGMTSQERALFDDLVARIRENKSEVLATLAGDAPPAGGDASPGTPDASPGTPGTPTDPGSSGDPDRQDATDAVPPEVEEPSPPEADDPVPPEAEEPAPPEADPDPDVLAGAMGGDPASSADDGSSSDLRGPTGSTDSAAGSATDAEPGAASTDGGPTPVEPDPAPPGAPGADGSVDGEPASAANGPAPAEADAPSPAADADVPGIDRETVRITRDVGEIFGVDEREYDLASEDVVTLPTANAEPLVERDAAERIE
ncbi:DNA replication complex subunit Gins51 [Halorubrum aethiopicum]|uniref:DNA replication complex subunit Gins51 n=1 Tax=Halorubrum aethiopicum TaxID=1758255 RepID=UPI0008341723|nr:hypothetical protein [Halorubrum aethiopicum]